MFFRNVLECAPLVTEPFAQDISTSVNNYTVYNYGPNFLGQNYTYQVETMAGQYDRQGDNSLRTNGANFILNSYPENGSTATSVSAFIPIPELYTNDGDLHLIFLQGNGVYFYENTTDPWYRATQFGGLRSMGGSSDGPNSTQSVYQPEEAASPLACVERYQFCNASKDCGPLAGKQTALPQAASLFNITAFDVYNNIVPNDPVGSRFYWFYLALFTMPTDLDVMLKNLGPKALLSQQSLLDGLIGPLPDDQWQLDVTYWWATRLASIQAAFVNTAYDTGNAALEAFRIRPYNSYMRDMCDNQKIKSTDYTSFSLFGLYFTYITGLVLIVASFSVEPVIACLYRRDQARKLKGGEYKYLEWASNGTLQLQRLAYQGIKSGRWSGYTDDIPMTEKDALLGDLTQSYPEVSQDLAQGPGKTHAAAGLRVVTVSLADENSEVAAESSNSDDEKLEDSIPFLGRSRLWEAG
ncbi:hypothetical protein SLS63_007664 [Diaporthe eres]|uniref:Uncharacterized protein n=1 Tax=Diaporthe eres TaxID=83184 RepID=A0ABR1P4V0_DIAER